MCGTICVHLDWFTSAYCFPPAQESGNSVHKDLGIWKEITWYFCLCWNMNLKPHGSGLTRFCNRILWSGRNIKKNIFIQLLDLWFPFKLLFFNFPGWVTWSRFNSLPSFYLVWSSVSSTCESQFLRLPFHPSPISPSLAISTWFDQ